MDCGCNNSTQCSRSLSGHDLLLCPILLQVPQRRLFLGGGHGDGASSSLLSSSTSPIASSTGVLAQLPGFGTDGSGQVMSRSSSGQNSQIESNRYHCCSGVRSFGGTSGGYSEGFGCHYSALFFRSTCLFSSASSECTFVYTTPGSLLGNLKWWYFLMPNSFLKCGAKNDIQSKTRTTVVPSSSVTS